MKKIIYDVGTDKYGDKPRYLKRAELVMAVEADPGLSDIIRQRFQAEVVISC
jgi:hypothetical protein